MRVFNDHLIKQGSKIKEALNQLDKLSLDAVLFVVDEDNKLKGSLTDGDVRRGLIKGITIDQTVDFIIQSNPKFLKKGESDLNKIIEFRENNFKIIPILNKENQIVNVINFRNIRSYLPVDVVIMAGGKGSRLRPLTETTPKPLLNVGDKPILEHNINRLTLYGIDDFWISVNYLGSQIENYFGNGNGKNVNIEYVWENEPLGTIGSVSKINNLIHDYVLVTNSDILTNINYEEFFLKFREEDSDFAVVTIPYKVVVPYAVLETSNNHVINFKEKPTYTYYSNAGIYLMKKEVLSRVPKDSYYDMTDLMENLISDGKKILSYPFIGYWLDIGKKEDYDKAQEDIKNIKF